MPELPEVEAAKRQWDKAARGKRIVVARAALDPIVFDRNPPKAVEKALLGRKTIRMGRKGKYFWCELDRKPWLVIHFGMSGSLLIEKKPLAEKMPRHVRLELELEDGTRLTLCDPRRFGRIRLAENPIMESPISDLGDDPLNSPPTVKQLQTTFGKTKRSVKGVLLDQRVFAGVGNWIADEVLYQAGIAPKRLAPTLSAQEIGRLIRCLNRILRVAVAKGANAEKFPKNWLFHDRWTLRDARTARGETIRRETVAGRTTAWVPTAQR